METPLNATEDRERAGGPLEVDEAVVDDMAVLLASGQRAMVVNLVADLHAADLERLLTHLPFKDARQLFHWLPVDQAGEVLAELDDAFRAELLEEASPSVITRLLDQLDTDDAVDVLADLPDAVAVQVLPRLEDVDDLRELLDYPEDTAGGIMGAEFIAVPNVVTVAEATEQVRRNAEAVTDVYAIFVVDAERHLEGVISLKQLLLTPAATPVRQIMDPDVITVTTDVDQEEVARVMERYDLVTLPVVNAQGQMVGRITIDDVVDVMREEAEEDMQRMSGVSGGEEPTHSVLRISRGRLPWLMMGMVGAGLSGTVINRFGGALQQAVVLASFIPIVMSMGGNAGMQSSAIVVQGIASGDLWASDVPRRLAKELSVALLNGLALAVILGGTVLVLPFEGPHMLRLAVTAALAMLTVIILATCIGTLIPLLLHKVNIDPAIATGPFITTTNDILGLAIFFLLATLIYL